MKRLPALLCATKINPAHETFAEAEVEAVTQATGLGQEVAQRLCGAVAEWVARYGAARERENAAISDKDAKAALMQMQGTIDDLLVNVEALSPRLLSAYRAASRDEFPGEETSAFARLQNDLRVFRRLHSVLDAAARCVHTRSGPRSSIERVEFVGRLHAIYGQVVGNAPGRSVNWQSGRPQGPFLEFARLCMNKAGDNATASQVDSAMKRLFVIAARKKRAS